MTIEIPANVKKIIERFRQNGFEAYAVGGCVRDILLGKTPEDWDITTNAAVAFIKNCFCDCRIIDTGIKHGTVTVLVDGDFYEITTYRKDGKYSDCRRPDEVFFTSDLKEDLSRRDFTINAIACDGTDTVDCFGGINDLQKGIIRCVGEADVRFSEDALRILRALRFSSMLGFKIDDKTAESIRKNYRLLEHVSAERIFSELVKLICGDGVYGILTGFPEVFAFIIPQAAPCMEFDQNNPHHNRSLWEHTAYAVGNAPKDAITRFSLLLHDFGKTRTKTTDENGVSHYYGHSEHSRIIAQEVLKQFKCSKAFSDAVIQLVALHDMPSGSRRTVKRLMTQCTPEQMRRLFDVKKADISALSDFKREEKLENLKKSEDIYAELIAEGLCLNLRDLKINGNDLMKIGIRPGKDMGRILNSLLTSVINEDIKNERSVLLEKAAELK